LASLADLSVTYLSEIERKNAIPAPSTLRKIAMILGVPISVFLGNSRKNALVIEKLINYRKQLGWSQKELALRAGVSPGLIGQIESSRVQVSLKTLEKIAKAMNISPCYLLLEQEEVDAVITAMCPELRDMLYDKKVQMTIGQICSMNKDQLRLVFNFINMIKNPILNRS
jgi:transcriptional regulator with XRE-family HTH domain